MAKRTNFWEVHLKRRTGSCTAVAMLLAYHKFFKDSNFRFLWSTGVEVAENKKLTLDRIAELINEQLEKDKPAFAKSVTTWGKKLKALRDVASKAFDDIQAERRTVTNETLKFRIELMRDGFKWVDESNELQMWDGKTVQYFTIPENISREVLEKQLRQEMSKQKPDFKRVIDTALTAGQNGLFGFWSGIIEGNIELRHGKKLRPSSKGVKNQSMQLVKQFDPLASFEKMDMAFYNSFVRWLKDQTVKVKEPDGTFKVKKRFDTNTIGKHIRQFKSVLHLGYRNELMQHDRFKYWPVTKESNEVVTLSKDELLKIHAINKDKDGEPYSSTKQDVKDIFVLAAFLGPRISDFKTFKKENLSTEAGITFFEYIQEKTGARVKIPLHSIALEILKKRGGEFPQMISEQNFRYYLKEICQDAELNDRVTVKIRDGKPEYKKKWQAITPHSARRTFASALFYGWFGKPMPASFCMRYTGHKTEKSFMLYIGASEADLDAKALEYFDAQPQMTAS